MMMIWRLTYHSWNNDMKTRWCQQQLVHPSAAGVQRLVQHSRCGAAAPIEKVQLINKHTALKRWKIIRKKYDVMQWYDMIWWGDDWWWWWNDERHIINEMMIWKPDVARSSWGTQMLQECSSWCSTAGVVKLVEPPAARAEAKQWT